jgi:hypothetical protein
MDNNSFPDGKITPDGRFIISTSQPLPPVFHQAPMENASALDLAKTEMRKNGLSKEDFKELGYLDTIPETFEECGPWKKGHDGFISPNNIEIYCRSYLKLHAPTGEELAESALDIYILDDNKRPVYVVEKMMNNDIREIPDYLRAAEVFIRTPLTYLELFADDFLKNYTLSFDISIIRGYNGITKREGILIADRNGTYPERIPYADVNSLTVPFKYVCGEISYAEYIENRERLIRFHTAEQTYEKAIQDMKDNLPLAIMERNRLIEEQRQKEIKDAYN